MALSNAKKANSERRAGDEEVEMRVLSVD